MKVYLVIYDYNDGGHDIKGIFKNKEDAEKAANEENYHKYDIEEFEVAE